MKFLPFDIEFDENKGFKLGENGRKFNFPSHITSELEIIETVDEVIEKLKDFLCHYLKFENVGKVTWCPDYKNQPVSKYALKFERITINGLWRQEHFAIQIEGIKIYPKEKKEIDKDCVTRKPSKFSYFECKQDENVGKELNEIDQFAEYMIALIANSLIKDFIIKLKEISKNDTN